MRVIVQRAYGQFSVGHVIPAMPGGVAREMIRRGLVAEAPTAAPADRTSEPGEAANAVRRRKAGERG